MSGVSEEETAEDYFRATDENPESANINRRRAEYNARIKKEREEQLKKLQEAKIKKEQKQMTYFFRNPVSVRSQKPHSSGRPLSFSLLPPRSSPRPKAVRGLFLL
ncbi:MAG: hypothetical protein V8T87_13125 [Victivallales bacterium]